MKQEIHNAIYEYKAAYLACHGKDADVTYNRGWIRINGLGPFRASQLPGMSSKLRWMAAERRGEL